MKAEPEKIKSSHFEKQNLKYLNSCIELLENILFHKENEIYVMSWISNMKM